MQHPVGEFLKLLQAVEAGRKVDGRSFHNITDGNIARAMEAESDRLQHLSADDGHVESDLPCPGCVAIDQKVNVLREWLHGQDVDLPADVL